MDDFPTMTRHILGRASLSGRDRREYEALLQSLDMMRSRIAEASLNLPIAMSVGGAMTLVMFAAASGLPFKKLRKTVARGDFSGLLPTPDLEESLLELAVTLSPPKEAADIRQQIDGQTARKATLACGSGCWFCCASHTNITVTIMEVERVWEAIRDRDLGSKPHPKACPALSADGRCAAYEVRPQPCRSYGSVSKEACRRALSGEPESPDEEDPFVHATSAYNLHVVVLTLTKALGMPAPFVDLLTALRDLRAGLSFERAITNAKAANQVFHSSGESNLSRWSMITS